MRAVLAGIETEPGQSCSFGEPRVPRAPPARAGLIAVLGRAVATRELRPAASRQRRRDLGESGRGYLDGLGDLVHGRAGLDDAQHPEPLFRGLDRAVRARTVGERERLAGVLADKLAAGI